MAGGRRSERRSHPLVAFASDKDLFGTHPSFLEASVLAALDLWHSATCR